jgi:sulfur carrier protein ThiS
MWYNKYVGIPYKEAGRDIAGIDCWGLLRLIYKEQYNIDIPSFSDSYTSSKDRDLTTELIAQNKEQWVQQENPEVGDGILFRVLGLETHIGVYLGDNKFIHAKEGHSSVIESLTSAKWKNRVTGYFRYTADVEATLNAVPHPLRAERYTENIKVGTTVAELVDSINQRYNISDKLKFNLAVMLNGIPILKETWATTVIKANDKVEYRAIPRGDDPLRLVLMVAVMFAAPYLGSLIVGATTGIAFTAVTMAIQMVGMALVDAIAPVRTPETKNPGQTEGINMFTGGSNQMNPYGSIPVVLGKIRMTPPLGAQPIVDSPEDTSYLRMMTVWGFGPLYLDDSSLLIGASALKDFKDSNGYEPERFNLDFNPASDSATAISRFSSIYSTDIAQDPIQVELDNADTLGMNRAVLYSGNRLVTNSVVYSGTASQGNLALTVNPSSGTFFLRDQGWYTDTETFTISATYENTTSTAQYTVYKNKPNTVPFASIRSSTDVIITDGENYILPSGNQVFLYGYGVNMTTVPSYNVQFSLLPYPTSDGHGLAAAIDATTGAISLSIPTAWAWNIAYFVFRATYTDSGTTQTKDIAYTVYKTSDSVFNNKKLVINYEAQVFTAAADIGAKLQDLPESSGTWQQAAIDDDCTELQIALHFPEGMRRLKVKGDGAGESSPTSFVGEYQYRKINTSGGAPEAWSTSAYTTSGFTFNVADFNPADAEYGNNYGTLYKWYRIVLTDGKGISMLEGDPSYSASPASPAVPGGVVTGTYHTAVNQSAYYAALYQNLPAPQQRVFVRLPDLPAGAKLLYDICLKSDSTTLSVEQTIDHRLSTFGVGGYSGLSLNTDLVNTNATDPVGGGGAAGEGGSPGASPSDGAGADAGGTGADW